MGRLCGMHTCEPGRWEVGALAEGNCCSGGEGVLIKYSGFEYERRMETQLSRSPIAHSSCLRCGSGRISFVLVCSIFSNSLNAALGSSISSSFMRALETMSGVFETFL